MTFRYNASMCNKICIAFDDISVEINGFDSEDDKLLYFWS